MPDLSLRDAEMRSKGGVGLMPIMVLWPRQRQRFSLVKRTVNSGVHRVLKGGFLELIIFFLGPHCIIMYEFCAHAHPPNIPSEITARAAG